jgi:hypothetical protein
MDTIGVGIIEDQKELREGLSFLLNSVSGFVCRHVYGSVETGLIPDKGVVRPQRATRDGRSPR